MSQDSLPTPSRSPKQRPNLLFRILKPLASLQLTIVLFLLSFILVFTGTIAMTTTGLWSVVDDYFRSFVVWIPFDLFRQFGKVFLLDIGFPKDMSRIPGSVPFPAGWTLGFALLINLLAAHTVRMKFTWNRAGVIMLHAGMILLMVGELVTGLYSVESTMVLSKGESADYVDVSRTIELAITDASDPKVDRVTIIPERYLTTPGEIVRVDDLPFDLRVTEYWENSKIELRFAKPEDRFYVPFQDKQDAGDWLPMYMTFAPEKSAAGVETGMSADLPSLKLEIIKKGTDAVLEDHFLSLIFYRNNEGNLRRRLFPKQEVTVDGNAYRLMLRNKRVYKPYTIKLNEFEHGIYPGTNPPIPKDFASEVTATHNETGDNNDVRIWMNNPLRYEGDSLYQHQVLLGDSGTVLQVVRNPGRIIPYLSCIMITLGMLIHFLIKLRKWLQRSPTIKRNSDPTVKRQRFNPLQTGPLPTWHVVIPWAILAIFTVWLGSKTLTPRPTNDGIDYYAMGELPIRQAGRVMPMSTLARTHLQYISGLTQVKNKEGDVEASAMQWLTSVFHEIEPGVGKSKDYQVFRIEHPQLLGLLNLEPRPGFYRYSYAEMSPKFDEFLKEYNRVKVKANDGDKIDAYDNALRELGNRVAMYRNMTGAFDIEVVPSKDGDDWLTMKQVLQETNATITEADEATIAQTAQANLAELLRHQYGPDPSQIPDDDKLRIRQLLQETIIPQTRIDFILANRDRVSPAAATLMQLINAAYDGRGEEFQERLSEYRNKYLDQVPQSELWNVEVEHYALNHLEPFHYCFVMYLVIIVVSLCSWLFLRAPMWQSAMLLTLLTFVIHTLGLLARMLVMDRPPVTNLYASAVFIGWGAVLLCLLLEWLYKNGLGLLTAGFVGAATAYIAKFLAADGDTMEKLQAVLDTNFWLAIHVTTVTLGYTATFVGGMLGVFWILRSVFTPTYSDADAKETATMMYGVLCFATLLSFFGTVSGGIWADYSWGRFWGWDPKENGAVLIVIWNALILHARWAGLVKGRGMAILAVLGNMVVAWSWFGTNQLQIGLHSYGFSSKLASGCFWFWLSQLIVIGFALTPRKAWLSVNPPSWAKSSADSSEVAVKMDEQGRPPMAKKSHKRRG